jgi:hypothetical protein
VRTLIVVITGSILLLSCSGSDDTAEQTDTDYADELAYHDSVVFEFEGVDSMSVFDLIQAGHELEYQSTISGKFVTEIDDLEVGSEYFWLFTVNDSVPSVACDEYITSDGDRVKWHYRKLEK